jgi:dipeptidyl aminopeptidase/acylaminoacyl peptidase
LRSIPEGLYILLVRLERIGASLVLLTALLNPLACSRRSAWAETLTIPHPDDPSKKVEAFFEKPAGSGPWPTVVLLHGYQAWPPPGGKDFVNWGVLDKLKKRGYLAIAVSQPGYGNSSGPADFCGPFTQNAVLGIIARLRANGYIAPDRVVIQGISRGALVAGLIATRDPSLAGIVLISGLYDLPEFAANLKTAQARQIVNAMADETGGGSDALRTRSVLYAAQKIKASTLILNGAKDDRTDPAQARRLAETITSHGVEARAIVYPDYGHQIPVEVRDKEIDPFIDRVLRK